MFFYLLTIVFLFPARVTSLGVSPRYWPLVSFVKHDNIRIFIGIKSGTTVKEAERRQHWRSVCAPTLPAAFVKWRFLVGTPEHGIDATADRDVHTHGRPYSDETRLAATSLVTEINAHSDVDIGVYTDHYMTKSPKLFHLMALGEKIWAPDWSEPADFVASMDVDMCLNYTQFLSGVNAYYHSFHNFEGHTESLFAPKIKFAYRNGGAPIQSDLNSATAYNDITNRTDSDNFGPRGTNSSVVAVFAQQFWKYIGTASNYTFCPFPSGWFYAYPQKFAHVMMTGQNSSQALLVPSRNGTSSDDQNMGVILHWAAQTYNVQIDYVDSAGAYRIEECSKDQLKLKACGKIAGT